MYLHTPASSSSSSSPPASTSVSDFGQTNHLPTTLPPTPKDQQPRNAQKNKFTLGLVGQCSPADPRLPCDAPSDQTVKSLCDIWPQEDMPAVLMVSSHPSVSIVLTAESLSNMIIQPRPRITQLPSPITPSTSRSPISPLPAPSPAASSSHSSTSGS